MSNHPRLVATSDTSTCVIEDEQGHRASFPRYQYQPLRPGRIIRLLKPQPHTRPWPLFPLSEIVEYSIVEHELESTDTDMTTLDVSESRYVTTSYAWGTPMFDAPLLINVQGQRTILPVTTSVWEVVLRNLPALKKCDKLMWIDQVCINQADEQEKAMQVMLMGDIYRRGWHCVIWLGPADSTTLDAYSLLDTLDTIFRSRQSNLKLDLRLADLSHAQIREMLISQVGNDLLPPPTDKGWTGLGNLLRREWFTRLWTLQETVLCYKGGASICCGEWIIPATTFMSAALLLGHDYNFTGVDFRRGRHPLMQVLALLGQVQNRQPTPLASLLQFNRARQCTNPRDRIFAFLGMRNEDGLEYPIRVNYQEPPERILTDVARRIIQSQQSLRLCADAPERFPNNGLPNLPTWVPDWTQWMVPLAFESDNPARYLFKACNQRIHVDDEQDPNILIAEGKAIDSIRHFVNTTLPRSNIGDQEVRKAWVQQVLPALWQALQSRHLEMDNVDMAHKIVTTITMDGLWRKTSPQNTSLLPDAWSAPVCEEMLSSILQISSTHRQLAPSIDPELWMNAMIRQATYCEERQFALLEHNLLAVVPLMAEKDDMIVILHGSTLPLVLRPERDDTFQLVGPCFVDGIMFGEKVDWTAGDEFRIC